MTGRLAEYERMMQDNGERSRYNHDDERIEDSDYKNHDDPLVKRDTEKVGGSHAGNKS